MSKIRIDIYNTANGLVGYFIDPEIETYTQGDYEIKGLFYNQAGQLSSKLDFNPEALPYTADLSTTDKTHKNLKNVYVQRGRQPVRMTGTGVLAHST